MEQATICFQLSCLITSTSCTIHACCCDEQSCFRCPTNCEIRRVSMQTTKTMHVTCACGLLLLVRPFNLYCCPSLAQIHILMLSCPHVWSFFWFSLIPTGFLSCSHFVNSFCQNCYSVLTLLAMSSFHLGLTGGASDDERDVASSSRPSLPTCNVCETSPAKHVWREIPLGDECFLAARSQLGTCKTDSDKQALNRMCDTQPRRWKAMTFGLRRQGGKRSMVKRATASRELQDCHPTLIKYGIGSFSFVFECLQ